MTVQIIAQAESHTDYLIAGNTKKGIKTHFHGTKKLVLQPSLILLKIWLCNAAFVTMMRNDKNGPSDHAMIHDNIIMTETKPEGDDDDWWQVYCPPPPPLCHRPPPYWAINIAVTIGLLFTYSQWRRPHLQIRRGGWPEITQCHVLSELRAGHILFVFYRHEVFREGECGPECHPW